MKYHGLKTIQADMQNLCFEKEFDMIMFSYPFKNLDIDLEENLREDGIVTCRSDHIRSNFDSDMLYRNIAEYRAKTPSNLSVYRYNK